MLTRVRERAFTNGKVYALRTSDNYLVEVTDTFLPLYTKECINENTNKLKDNALGSRLDRWMIGISCMSGCPVHCKFCATGQMKKYRNLTAEEIVQQVEFILEQNPQYNFEDAKEHKINYTRMGEPFLNIEEVKKAIQIIDSRFKNVHHYISTIGLRGSDFSWIKDNITLQISLHSLDEERRHNLIPIQGLMSIQELGNIRVRSNLKITVNMTLVDTNDFDINILKQYFNTEHFFIKLSPINENEVSKANKMGSGVIESKNIV